MNGVYFKPSLEDSVDRFECLWAREAKDRVLVKIDISDSQQSYVTDAYAAVPDYEKMVAEWEKGFSLVKDIPDDNLPVVYGELGGYILGGFLGAKVGWGKGGAYSEPLINDIKNYKDYLKFEKDNRYFTMQMDYLRFLSEHSKGKYFFTEMITIDGLNFLDCVRGGEAYTDIYDYPEEITQIMDFGSELNIWLVKEQRKVIDKYKGGRFNFYQIWTPEETIFISVDAYGQCSEEVFEQFGRKYVQKMADAFGGCFLHVHSDAMRLLPNYVKLNNLVAIGLEDWIKPPRAMEHIAEIRNLTEDIPLMVNIGRREFMSRMDLKTLPGNIIYWIRDVQSVGEARELSLLAYRYRAPYHSSTY